MIILADLLNIFIPLVILVQVVVSLLLILVVLMQRPKQEGLGATFGAGMTDQMFGAQTTSVLQKATVFLGITFIASTLILAIMYTRKNTTSAIETTIVAEEVAKAKAESDEPSLVDQLTEAEKSSEQSSASNTENEPTPIVVASEEAPAVKEIIDEAKASVEEVKKEIKKSEVIKVTTDEAGKTSSKILEDAKDAVESAAESIPSKN